MNLVNWAASWIYLTLNRSKFKNGLVEGHPAVGPGFPYGAFWVPKLCFGRFFNVAGATLAHFGGRGAYVALSGYLMKTNAYYNVIGEFLWFWSDILRKYGLNYYFVSNAF